MSTPNTQQHDVPENAHSRASTQSLTSRQEPISDRDAPSLLGFEGDIPPQRHADKLNAPGRKRNEGANFGDKFVGLEEEIKGKILRKPDVAKRGHDMRTGELRRREQEEAFNADPSGTASNSVGGTNGPNEDHDALAGSSERPERDTKSSNLLSADHEMQRAATISPQGTESAEVQRKGGNVEGVKMIG